MTELVIDRESPQPIKGQIQQWLQNEIIVDHFSAGDRIPSINYLAKNSGIARDTVRLALEDLVQQGWIVPEHGKGYFVKTREERGHQIGILGKIDGVYIRQIYDELHNSLNDNSNILFIDSRQSATALKNAIQNLAYQHAVDRLLIIPPRGQEDQFSELIDPFRRYFSVAWMDRAPQNTVDATFICDYTAVVKLAFEQFNDQQVDSYVYFSRQAEDKSVFSTMRKSFKQCLKQSAKTGQIVNSIDVMLQLVDKQNLVIICETDEEGLYLQSNLLGRGISIGDEIKLISCDSSPLARLAYPPLPSIDPGFKQIGQAVAQWINSEHQQTHFVTSPVLLEDN